MESFALEITMKKGIKMYNYEFANTLSVIIITEFLKMDSYIFARTSYISL